VALREERLEFFRGVLDALLAGRANPPSTAKSGTLGGATGARADKGFAVPGTLPLAAVES